MTTTNEKNEAWTALRLSVLRYIEQHQKWPGENITPEQKAALIEEGFVDEDRYPVLTSLGELEIGHSETMAPKPTDVHEMTVEEIRNYGLDREDFEPGSKLFLAVWPDRGAWYEQTKDGFSTVAYNESGFFTTADEAHAWLWARVEITTPPNVPVPDPRTIHVFVTGDGPNWKGTLAEFFKINEDGIGAEDQAEITRTVLAGNVYKGGGGAAGEYAISKYDAPQKTAKRLSITLTTKGGRKLLGRNLDSVRANGDPATLERYYDEGTGTALICSTDEREECEAAGPHTSDSDTLSATDFAALASWMMEHAGLRVEQVTTKKGT